MDHPFWGLIVGLVIGCSIAYAVSWVGDAAYRGSFRNCTSHGFTQEQCLVILGPNRW